MIGPGNMGIKAPIIPKIIKKAPSSSNKISMYFTCCLYMTILFFVCYKKQKKDMKKTIKKQKKNVMEEEVK